MNPICVQKFTVQQIPQINWRWNNNRIRCDIRDSDPTPSFFTFPFACIQNDKLSLPSLSPFCDELFDEISAGQKYYGFLFNFDVVFLALLFTQKPHMDRGDKGRCHIVQALN